MCRGLIYIDENYAEFGYFPESPDNIRIFYEGNVILGISYEALKSHLGFDYAKGWYVLGKDVNEGVFPQGRDNFPYNLNSCVYNAKFEEHLFKNKQKYENIIDFKHINELPYSFGLEFETAGGYLPQHRLYELGLIPLRDGSITGIEYTTVVLQGNLGVNLLKQQIESLNKSTIFDKDCSLHIHFGGFKLEDYVLLAVNNLFVNSDIARYVPVYTFDTTSYKTNRAKNYCAFNNKYKSFSDMYRDLVGRNFYGDFYQSHPNDITGTRKWNIGSRYKAVNFINALCYKGPKTIEFRILRPSYNFDRILGWLFIFSAFIKAAENTNKSNSCFRGGIQVKNLIRSVYSSELSAILCDFLDNCNNVVNAQSFVRDYFGMRIDIDDKLINYNTFGKYFY